MSSTRLPRHTTPPDRQVVDLEDYVPFYISAISNAWSRGASRLYLQRFGIGAHDWAVLSTLAIEPGIPALRVCQIANTDKASVSRSLARLEDKTLVAAAPVGRDPRKRTFELTEAGYGLHDRILKLALAREEILLDGLAEDEVAQLIGLLRRLQANTVGLQAHDTTPES